jgi:hypothetical protein
MSQELGKLQPFRDVISGIEEWERTDRDNRGDSDDVVRALAKLRRRLEEALAEAEDPKLTISVDEYAQLKGLNRFTAYRRWQKIPGARKVGGRVEIPLSAVA